jgi:hypothetical protein
MYACLACHWYRVNVHTHGVCDYHSGETALLGPQRVFLQVGQGLPKEATLCQATC